MKLRSPLRQARGLGSAKEGSDHWVKQRISAIGLIFLVIWLIIAMLQFPAINAETMTAQEMRALAVEWYSNPINAIMCILLMIGMFYHGALGIQVVLEDYVSCECGKKIMITLTKLACFAGAATGVFSILSLYFKG